jgi:photosystem II stability/assembly factor-like uncharacterized protein
MEVNTLFWTRDGGAHWSDITPRAPSVPKGATLDVVFFRDTSEGWAVVSYPERIATLTPQAFQDRKTIYAIAHTENSGENWSATPLVYPALPDWLEETFAGPVSLFFEDSTHGWLDVAFAGNARPGKLLATVDGGHTWNWVNSPTFSGPILFTSLNDGWLISNWGADELYATHDGAKSWEEVKLTPPPDVGGARHITFVEMPIFQDSRNGYLAVHYSGSEGTPSKLVVYASHSSGRLWQPVKTLSVPTYAAFALIDSTLILPIESEIGGLSTISASVADQNQPTNHVSARGVLAFSFADRNDGWAQKSNGLYATTDGGATWERITPPPLFPSLPHVKVVVPSAPAPDAENLSADPSYGMQPSSGAFWLQSIGG